MTRSSADLRRNAASIALLVGFAASAFFSGVGTNLAILAAVAAMGLLGISLVGIRPLIAGLKETPLATAVAVAALCVLVFNVQTSLSKDSSFGPAWVLAAGPMTFIASGGLGARHRNRVVLGVSAIVTLFASISFARWILYGERASLPLPDPNNYGTLMYLVWIPFVHRGLGARWNGRASPVRSRPIEYTVAFVLLVALFATQSRTSLVVVCAAFAFWACVAWSQRRELNGVVAHAAIAGAAMITVLLLSPPDLVTNRIASVGAGVGVRQDLIDAGWRMYHDRPITGVGVFCFSLLYAAYRPLSEQLTAGLFVHNDYVQLLAEGGPLLAVLPLALAFAAVRVVARTARAAPDSPAYDRLGPALAVSAACTHALVNFVFYTVTLSIVLGLLAAMMVARAPSTGVASERVARVGLVAGLVFGWLAWLYLALDVVTVAVFQDQPGVPFVDSLRSTPERQLRYARFAQELNGERGIPVLGEAMLLARQPAAADGTQPGAEETLAQFRRAIEVDPWNPLGYVSLADFVARRGASLDLRADEAPNALLLKALAIDPINVPAIDQLLERNRQIGRLGDSYALLGNVVFPWLELLKRKDDQAAGRYLDEMADLATRVGDSAFAERIAKKRAALEHVAPKVHRGWFESGT